MKKLIILSIFFVFTISKCSCMRKSAFAIADEPSWYTEQTCRPSEYIQSSYGPNNYDKPSKKLSDLPSDRLKVTTIDTVNILDLSNLDLRDANEIASLKVFYDGEQVELKSVPKLALNLANNRIWEIPKSIGELQLLALNLSYNPLAEQTSSLPQSPNYLPDFAASFEKYPKNSAYNGTILSMSLNNLIIQSNWFHHNTLNLSKQNLTTLNGIHELFVLYRGEKVTIKDVPNLFVDASHNKLTSLPDSIGNLTNLKRLNLSHNQLTTLPDSIGSLANLGELNLSHNQLTALPHSIGSLAKLGELNLLHNQLTSFPDTITHLTQLKKLDFSYNPMPVVPESLEPLDLNNVLIYNESITDIQTIVPQNRIKQKHNHLQLDLSNLNLTSLIGLKKLLPYPTSDILIDIDLSNNPNLNFSNLFKRLSLLPRPINSVILSHNQLTDIPKIPINIKTLDLSNNRISSLHSLEGQASIENLNVASNNLSNIDTLPHMPKLRNLNLSNNRIHKLPDSFAHQTLMEELDLSRNHFDHIPTYFSTFNHLSTLNLACNQLKHIDVSNISSLQVLSVAANQLIRMPVALYPHLKFLNISYNPKLSLSDDDFTYWSQQTAKQFFYEQSSNIAISPCKLIIQENGTCNVLDLSHERLITTPANPNKLYVIVSDDITTDLSEDPFEDLWAIMPDGRNLQLKNVPNLCLKLNHNQLQVLPENFFTSLPHLVELNLASNQLQALPEIPPSSNLVSLNIANNKLTMLPSSLSNLGKLQKLSLFGNQLAIRPLFISVNGKERLEKIIYFISPNQSNPMLNAVLTRLASTGNLHYLGSADLLRSLKQNPNFDPKLFSELNKWL